MLLSDPSPSADLLNYNSLARILVERIKGNAENSSQIAIYGDSGSGKTRFITLLESHLAKESSFLCIRASGLQFLEKETAKTAIFELIAHPLRGLLLDQMDVESDSTPSRVASQIIETSPLTELLSLLEQVNLGKVILFLDDLDGCSHKIIIEILDALRSFHLSSKLSFVLAADETKLLSSLKQHLAKEESPANVAQVYLSGLIHLSIRLAPLCIEEVESYSALLLLGAEGRKAPDLSGQALLDHIVKSASDNPALSQQLAEVITLARLFSEILANGAKGNPREIKRFINAYLVRLEIAGGHDVLLEQDRQALMKVMLAEYFHLEFLKQVGKWMETSCEGRSLELRKLERLASSERFQSRAKKKRQNLAKWEDEEEGEAPAAFVLKPGSVEAWSVDPWVRKWVFTGPLLNKLDLRTPFFLARESLGYIGKASGDSRLNGVVDALLGDKDTAANVVWRLPLFRSDEAELVFLGVLSKLKKQGIPVKRPHGLIELAKRYRKLRDPLLQYFESLPDSQRDESLMKGLGRLFSNGVQRERYRMLYSKWTGAVPESLINHWPGRIRKAGKVLLSISIFILKICWWLLKGVGRFTAKTLVPITLRFLSVPGYSWKRWLTALSVILFLSLIHLWLCSRLLSSIWCWNIFSDRAYGGYGDFEYALLSGQINLVQMPGEKILHSPNPYIPAGRLPNADYLLDYSMYKGKLYFYFGAVPALTVGLPLRWLLGHLPSESSIIFLYAFFNLIAFFALIRSIIIRQWPSTPIWLECLVYVTYSFCNFQFFNENRTLMYQVAVTSVWAYECLFFYLMFRVTLADKWRWAWIVATSLGVGLAVGCRPTSAFLYPVMGLYLIWLQKDYWLTAKSRREIVALGLTAAFCLLLIGWYNEARFDDPLEFGLTYQLNDGRMYHKQKFELRYLLDGLWSYYISPWQYRSQFPYVNIRPNIAIPGITAPDLIHEQHVGMLTFFPIDFVGLCWPFIFFRKKGFFSREMISFCILITAWAITIGLLLSSYLAVAARYEVEIQLPLIIISMITLLARRQLGKFTWIELGVLSCILVYSYTMGVAMLLEGEDDWIQSFFWTN